MYAAELFRLSPSALDQALPGFRTPEEALATPGVTGDFDVAIDDDRVVPLERFDPVWLETLTELLPGRTEATEDLPLETVKVADLEGGPWVLAVDEQSTKILAGLDEKQIHVLGTKLSEAVRADLLTLEDEEFRAIRLADHSKQAFIDFADACAALAAEALDAEEQLYVLYGEADDEDGPEEHEEHEAPGKHLS